VKLELYYFDGCPFCQKVFRYMEERGITVTMRNIYEDDDAYRTLKETGGKIQVPCLMIDGHAMYESDDIITWMERNLA
jgi:glutaredoxin 3